MPSTIRSWRCSTGAPRSCARSGAASASGARRSTCPQRERAVLDRLTAAANGAFPREAVRPVFREIMSACLSLESPLVVSYPGPEATFSHLAGKTRFGLSALLRPAASLGEVFREVGRGADYGVVPVEEASEGLVTHALDHFIDSDLLIVAEIVIEAAHALLTHSGTTAGHRAGVRAPGGGGALRGRAGRGGRGARRSWRRRRRPRPRRWRARICARRALAPALAAELFDLAVAKPAWTTGRPTSRASWCWGAQAPRADRGRRDQPAGRAGRQAGPPRRGARTGWAKAGLNLRRIASRPTDRRGLRDLFFVDVDGHRDDPGCEAALDAARRAGCRC